jgi:hypothetical protein
MDGDCGGVFSFSTLEGPPASDASRSGQAAALNLVFLMAALRAVTGIIDLKVQKYR